MSTTTYSHPHWCDPRGCKHSDSNLDHRSVPLQWRPNDADVEMTVGLVRLDEIGYFNVPGTVNVMLTVDATFPTADGQVEIDMSPADARMLAAALMVRAERAEREQRVEAEQRSTS